MKPVDADHSFCSQFFNDDNTVLFKTVNIQSYHKNNILTLDAILSLLNCTGCSLDLLVSLTKIHIICLPLFLHLLLFRRRN